MKNVGHSYIRDTALELFGGFYDLKERKIHIKIYVSDKLYFHAWWPMSNMSSCNPRPWWTLLYPILGPRANFLMPSRFLAGTYDGALPLKILLRFDIPTKNKATRTLLYLRQAGPLYIPKETLTETDISQHWVKLLTSFFRRWKDFFISCNNFLTRCLGLKAVSGSDLTLLGGLKCHKNPLFP